MVRDLYHSQKKSLTSKPLLATSEPSQLRPTRRKVRPRRRTIQRTPSRTVIEVNTEIIIHKVGKMTKFKLRTGRMLITYKTEDAKNVQKVVQHIPTSSIGLQSHDQRGNQQEGHQEEDQEVTGLIDVSQHIAISCFSMSSPPIGRSS